jgi:hypothetical protein
MVSALIAKLANTTKLLSLLIPKWLEVNSYLITHGFSLLVKCIQLNKVFICNTFKAHQGVNVKCQQPKLQALELCKFLCSSFSFSA